MNAFEIVGGVLLAVVCLVIIGTVMMQESKGRGMGVITGQETAGFGKGRAKTKEALLNRVSKIGGIAFFAISLAVCIITVYVK